MDMDSQTLELFIAVGESTTGIFLVLIWLQNDSKKTLTVKFASYFDRLLAKLDKIIDLLE